MCGCGSHRGQQAQAERQSGGVLSFLVEDMTCGHCAGRIKSAIESALPGAQVVADPATKVVSVSGASDAAAVHGLVSAAGYTPSAMPMGA